MSEPLRISAKHLGELALPDLCPKCFQIKMKMNWKLPFQIFPGIFSSIDSYSKKVTELYYERNGELPPWLGIKGRPLKIPSPSRFRWHDEVTNILLTGTPDAIIERPDGTFAIIDYKTARYTKGQDELLPLYKVQLNGYALIAESIGMKPVADLLLVYYEPYTDINTSNVGCYIAEDGFSMLFQSKTITLDREGLQFLMKKAVEIYNSDSLEHKDGCKEKQRIVDFVWAL